MEFLAFIKDIFEEKKILLCSLGFMVILMLASAKMTLAIAVGVTVTLALTVSSAVTNALGRFSTATGSRIIYVSVTALICALAAVFVSLKYPDVSDTFSLVAAILPVSGVAETYYSKKDNIVYASVRSFSTGVIFTASAFVISFIREFFGAGTLFGAKFTECDVPFLRGNYGCFVLCGVILAVINALLTKKSSINAKKVQKKSINTEADDADS